MQYKSIKTPFLAFAPDLNEMLPYLVVEDEFPFLAVFYTAHKEVAEEIAKRLNDNPLPKLDFMAALKNALDEKGIGTTLTDFEKLTSKQ